MTNIPIPPEAVEAAAQKLAFELGYVWGSSAVDWDAFRGAATAALRAALKAWPGMFRTEMEEAAGVRRRVILPLPPPSAP